MSQALHDLLDFMRQTGVGSLPMSAQGPEATSSAPLTEQALIAQINVSIEHDYERQRRLQESAAVVASLLAASERR
jgi:hypothetical protein